MNLKIAILSLIIVASAAQAQDAPKPLTGEEVRAAIEATPVWNMEMPSQQGQKYLRLEFKNNGYVYGNIASASDTGPWHVQGDKLCFTLRTWTFKEVCAGVTKNDNGTYNIGKTFKGRNP